MTKGLYIICMQHISANWGSEKTVQSNWMKFSPKIDKNNLRTLTKNQKNLPGRF